MRKTAPINLMVTEETKRKLREKAKALGLTITSYVEKISHEPVIFADDNLKALLKHMDLK